MAVRFKTFILLFSCLFMTELTKAHLNLPLCKKQPNIVDYFSKILRKNGQNSAVKRELSTWPLSCLYAAIIKDENQETLFSSQIYACCNECEFPYFSLCTLAGYPSWMCGGQAYDCVFACRDEYSVVEAVHEAAFHHPTGHEAHANITIAETKRVRKKLRRLRKRHRCYKKKCTGKKGKRKCCLANTCVPLKKLQKTLHKQNSLREKGKQ